MATYVSIHKKLVRVYGSARRHLCACGAPAKDWAYQHTAGDTELKDEMGQVYSADPADYAAMCKSCHVRLDGTAKPNGDAFARRMASDPDFREPFRQRGMRNGALTVSRMAADPEFRERQLQACSRAGKSSAATRMADPALRRLAIQNLEQARTARRRCDGCGRVSTPGGLAAHQKSSGHNGWAGVPSDRKG